MLFERLKDVLRVQPRILVIQPNHISHRKQSVGDAIDPGPPVLLPRQRIAQGVDHFPFGHPAGGDLP